MKLLSFKRPAWLDPSTEAFSYTVFALTALSFAGVVVLYNSTWCILLVFGASAWYARHAEHNPVLCQWHYLLILCLLLGASSAVLGYFVFNRVLFFSIMGIILGEFCVGLPLLLRISIHRSAYMQRHLKANPRVHTLLRLTLLPSIAAITTHITSWLSPLGFNYTPTFVLSDVMATHWLSSFVGPVGRMFIILMMMEGVFENLKCTLILAGGASAIYQIIAERSFANQMPAAVVLLTQTCDREAVRTLLLAAPEVTLVVPTEEMCEVGDDTVPHSWRSIAMETNTYITNTYRGKYNSLEVYTPDGSRYVYNKVHPIPFEYVTPATDHHALAVDIPLKTNPELIMHTNFIICNDSAFAHLAQQRGRYASGELSKNRPHLIVAPSADGGEMSWIPAINAGMMLRAPENGATYIRHTANGVSEASDPWGRRLYVSSPTKSKDKSHAIPEMPWFQIIRVPLQHAHGVFARIGIWADFIITFCIVTAFCVLTYPNSKIRQRIVARRGATLLDEAATQETSEEAV